MFAYRYMHLFFFTTDWRASTFFPWPETAARCPRRSPGQRTPWRWPWRPGRGRPAPSWPPGGEGSCPRASWTLQLWNARRNQPVCDDRRDADETGFTPLPVEGPEDLLVLPEFAAVRAAHHPGAGLVLAEHDLHGVCDFTDRTSGRKKKVKTMSWAMMNNER